MAWGHRDEQTRTLARFLRTLEADPEAPVPPNLGPWTTLALALAFDRRDRPRVASEVVGDLAWRLWKAGSLANQEAAWQRSLFARGGMLHLPPRLSRLSSVLRLDRRAGSAARREDPWWIPVAAGRPYDRPGPFESASRGLLSEGRYGEAWRALVTASVFDQ